MPRQPATIGGSRSRGAFHISTFLVQALVFVLRPAAIYRALELGVPVAWLGALGASFALAPLLLAVGVGHGVDRYGEGRAMTVGAATLLGAALIYATMAGSIAGLVLGTIVLGLGQLCSVVGQQVMVANTASRRRYDSAFGRYSFVVAAGQTAGPVLILFAGGRGTIPHTQAIFWACAILCAVHLAVVVAIRSSNSGESHARSRGSVRGLLAEPSVVCAITVSGVVLAAIDISLVYLPLLGAERNIASATIAVLLGLRAAASMASRFFVGSLSERLGRGRLLTIGILTASGSTALLPVGHAPMWVTGFLVVVIGFGLGVGQPLTMSWLTETTPHGFRGRAMSLRLTGNRLGQLALPSAAGALAASAGAAGVFWVTASSLALAGMLSRGMTRGSSAG